MAMGFLDWNYLGKIFIFKIMMKQINWIFFFYGNWDFFFFYKFLDFLNKYIL